MNVFSFVFDIESTVDAFDIDANNIVDIDADIAVEHIVVDDLHIAADVVVVDADQYFLAAAVDLVVVHLDYLQTDGNAHVQSAADVVDEDDHDLGCKLNITVKLRSGW